MAILDNYKGSTGNHSGRTFDVLLNLFSGALTTVSDVIELGTGFVDADLVLLVSGVVPADTAISVQLSTDAAFTTPVAQQTFIPVTGRNIKPFRNSLGQENPYAFIRLNVEGGGPVTCEAFLAKK